MCDIDFSSVDWESFRSAQEASAQHDTVRRFYQACQLDPNQPISKASFVALDFETTGLTPEEHEIISVGMVPFTAGRIQLNDSRSWLVKPRKQLADDSVLIHGITHADLEQAPDLMEVLDDILAVLASKVVVVHFKYIERDFLYHQVQQRLGDELLFPLIDTMAIEAFFHRQQIGAKLKRLLGGKPVSIRLADSRGRYGLPRYPLHSAMTDALATAELLQAQLRHHYDDSRVIGDLWE